MATETANQRGRTAANPLQIGWRGYWDVARRVASRTARDRIGLTAAGVAFFALLALFPGITALVAVAGLILDADAVMAQFEAAATAAPDAVRTILLDQVSSVASGSADGLGVAALAGIGLAIYSSSRGVANLMAGLNVAYAEDEKRGFVRLTLTTLALTVFMIVVLSLALAVVAILPAVLSILGESVGALNLAAILRWPFLLLIGALAFSVFYRFGPSRRPARWRWLAPGAIMACLLWVAASMGFGWYVETLGNYTETFGALAGIIVLLLWLWISTFVVLLGALMDGELEAQTEKDSTIGDDRPMGQRGAVKADTCVAGQ